MFCSVVSFALLFRLNKSSRPTFGLRHLEPTRTRCSDAQFHFIVTASVSGFFALPLKRKRLRSAWTVESRRKVFNPNMTTQHVGDWEKFHVCKRPWMMFFSLIIAPSCLRYLLLFLISSNRRFPLDFFSLFTTFWKRLLAPHDPASLAIEVHYQATWFSRKKTKKKSAQITRDKKKWNFNNSGELHKKAKSY